MTLNGIAQGFAADRAVEALRHHGIEHALVNTGEIAALGHKSHGEPWTVGIRLLISGICVLRDGFVPVEVSEHREQLLAIKRGDVPWEETERWRYSLHDQFDKALRETKLPERPDYEKANEFLIKARRAALSEGLP